MKIINYDVAVSKAASLLIGYVMDESDLFFVVFDDGLDPYQIV